MFFLFVNTFFLHEAPRDPFRWNASSTMPEVGVYCRRGYKEFIRARRRRYYTHPIQLGFFSAETDTGAVEPERGRAESRGQAALLAFFLHCLLGALPSLPTALSQEHPSSSHTPDLLPDPPHTLSTGLRPAPSTIQDPGPCPSLVEPGWECRALLGGVHPTRAPRC